jgi:hypothetical protein
MSDAVTDSCYSYLIFESINSYIPTLPIWRCYAFNMTLNSSDFEKDIKKNFASAFNFQVNCFVFLLKNGRELSDISPVVLNDDFITSNANQRPSCNGWNTEVDCVVVQ